MATEGTDTFCGSPLWDLNITWYTESPELTPCFQKTVLTWGPCFFLWLFTPLEIFYLYKSRCKDIPWNILNTSKILITAILVVLSVVDISHVIYRANNGADIYPVDYVTPTFKLISFVLAGVLTHFNRVRGLQASGLLWQFWFYLIIFGIPQMRSEARAFNAEPATPETSHYDFYSYVIFYAGAVVLFILNCFADAEPSYSSYERTEKLYPEVRASFLSRLLFAWFDSLAWKGFRHPLETKDLWDLSPEDLCKTVAPDFLKSWDKAVKRASERPLAGDAKASPKAGRRKRKGVKKYVRFLTRRGRSSPEFRSSSAGAAPAFNSRRRLAPLTLVKTIPVRPSMAVRLKATKTKLGRTAPCGASHAIAHASAHISARARGKISAFTHPIVCIRRRSPLKIPDIPQPSSMGAASLAPPSSASIIPGTPIIPARTQALRTLKCETLAELQEPESSGFGRRAFLQNRVHPSKSDSAMWASPRDRSDTSPSLRFRFRKSKSDGHVAGPRSDSPASPLRSGSGHRKMNDSPGTPEMSPELKNSSHSSDDTVKSSEMNRRRGEAKKTWRETRKRSFQEFSQYLIPGNLQEDGPMSQYSDAQPSSSSQPPNEIPIVHSATRGGTRTGKASFRQATGSVEITNKQQAKKQASILPVLCKVFGPTFLFGSLLKLFQDVLTFISPQILKLLIDFVQSREYTWKGYLYAFTMLLVATIQTVILAQYFNRMFLVGIRIRTALIAAIYKKALRMSNSSRKETTVGEIVNLMSVDAQRFMDVTAYINMIWSAPLQIALALYFLWGTLGVSVLSGLAVMIFMIPVNGVIANKVKSLQITQMKYKDERVKLMNEILSGIKVLKLYAWEPSFEEQISRIRDKEIAVLRTAAYLNAATAFVWACAPFLVSMLTFVCYVMLNDANSLTADKVFVSITLFEIMRVPLGFLPIVLVYGAEVSLASFATYVLVDENNILDAKTAFFSLSLFNILRFPLSMLPMMISNMVQTAVSITRINKFMNCEELNLDDVSHDPKEGDPVIIDNGTFSWGSEEPPILKNINVSIKKGSLVAVVGSVGSGKSSLLSAFLGEMDKISGKVNTHGHIAYVPQQAWILNATLRNNILFGGTDSVAQYNKVVEACALKSDFEMLPAGDQTEIGEKGINLSGGQKQRVSLARAVFCDADIYLLDDPLSAVDSHVGKHIFEKVLGPHGVLKKKTRILVTHSITYLPECDHIIVLNNGEISETGTFKELLQKKGAFAEFLLQHLQEVDVGDYETDLEEIKAQLEHSIGAEEVQRELQRHISRLSETQDGDANNPKNQLKRSISNSSGKLTSGSAEHINNVRRRTSSIKESPAHTNNTEKAGEKLIEQEKVETGSVKFTVYAHYLKSIGLLLTLATIVLNIIYQAFSVGSSVWLSVWANDESNFTTNSSEYAAKRDMYLGVYGGLGLGQVIFVVALSLCLQLGCLRAAKRLHRIVLYRIFRNKMSFYDVTPIGRILNRFSGDIFVCDQTLPSLLTMFLSTASRVIGTVAVISYSTPIFITIIVPIGILYYFVQRFYVAASRQLKRLESVSRSPIYSHFSESITGASSIRAYGVQERFIGECEDKVDFNQVCFYPIMIANRWLAVRLEMVGNCIIFFAALFAVIDRESNAGLVGLSVSYALQITQTLNWLVRMTSEVETNIVAVERIKEYGDTPQEAAWTVTPPLVGPSWPDRGQVEFVDYKVRYRAGLDLVLKGVKFVITGGEKVGIVGRTGAGKSSLTLGLFRIVEAAEGKILIDDVDISKLGLHELRNHLTIIPQDPVLFSGTLRLNLDPFGKYSDSELWQALEHAHLKAFVKELSAGLEYGVTEGGENLSVGQRQLICLARALLRKTRVLVLDEATAAVDLETDDLIQTTIRQEFKECTVLTIAHRLNTVMDSDRVLVLDKGYVVEYDTPQKLLSQKNSIFYGMAKDAGIAQ